MNMNNNDDSQPVFFESAGTGKPIILLHGWGGNLHSWFPVYKILKKQYHVYAPDLPGFGSSPLPEDVWGISEYALCISRFIVSHSLTDVCLIGHSFGGQIAAKIASENPAFLSHLILTDSAGIRNPKGLRNLGLLLTSKLGNAAFSLPYLRNFKKHLRATYYAKIGEHDYEQAGALQNIFKRVVSEDFRPYIKNITVPTLLIWGSNDKATPRTHGALIQKLITGSKLVVFPGCSHFAYLEKPDDFCKTVSDFIC